MNKIKLYGFMITDANGFGFQRMYDDSEIIYSTDRTGTLPMPLKSIHIAQHAVDFKAAYAYCCSAAKEHRLTLTQINENDWEKIESPVSSFFKNMFKSRKK